MNLHTLEEVRAVKVKARQVFARFGKLAGLGITRVGEGYGLKVNLHSPKSDHWPSEISGVPIRVEVVGQIKKRAARPLLSGAK